MKKTVAERKQILHDIRKQMGKRQIDAYIVTMFDDHHSEYVSPDWRTIEWISGFSGSAGTLVITSSEAALWTDGRYFIQAATQIAGTGIKLVKDRIPGQPKIHEWILERCGKNARIAADGRTITISFDKTMSEHFECINWQEDLVSFVWKNRPAESENPVFIHDVSFAGKSRMEKINAFRDQLSAFAEASLITSLEDIAWILNLRGSDVLNNPVFYAFLYVDVQGCVLFTDEVKLSAEIKQLLAEDGIEWKDTETVYDFMRQLDPSALRRLHMDPGFANILLKQAVPEGIDLVLKPSPTLLMKAVKNKTEIDHLRQTAVTEGLALTRLSKWIKESALPDQVSEQAVAEKMHEIRKKGQHFIDDSFPTIAAFNANAAQMHYNPGNGASAVIDRDGVLLVDTGGHYMGGTTDVTRTYMIGSPDLKIKEDFTLVLKSNIALSRPVFLQGTSGQQLDVLARLPMWEKGLDYKCGTGHGVGYLLSVHEGPQSFSANASPVDLEPGMIITNEPGIYKEGLWGIRIENMMLVKEAMKTEDGTFYQFETVSYCPIDLDGVLTEQLSQKEKDWLNQYHQDVYQKLSPFLDASERDWLKINTRPV